MRADVARYNDDRKTAMMLKAQDEKDMRDYTLLQTQMLKVARDVHQKSDEG